MIAYVKYQERELEVEYEMTDTTDEGETTLIMSSATFGGTEILHTLSDDEFSDLADIVMEKHEESAEEPLDVEYAD